MNRSLATYITLLVGAAAVALLTTGFVFPVESAIGFQFDADPLTTSGVELTAGLVFWTVATFVASSLPVRLSDGVQVAVSTAPLMAAAVLGGPTAAAWVALIGTTDSREIRRRVAWYGTLTNHAAIVLPVVIGGAVIHALRGTESPERELVATLAGTLVYFLLNLVFVSLVVLFRSGRPIRARPTTVGRSRRRPATAACRRPRLARRSTPTSTPPPSAPCPARSSARCRPRSAGT